MLYRGEVLEMAPHRNLFLDMEENIHIHYRDLRIELSRAEFEEIVNTFSKQSKELMEIIHEKNYRDGKLPNSNQEDTRIWTESRLHHPVKYHPKRISIEDCTDGYHIHLRNYKFLLSPEDFEKFHQAVSSIDINKPHASSKDEVIQLFEDNHIDFAVTREDLENNTTYITVANYHLSKIRTICDKIGLSREIQVNKQIISNDKHRIEVQTTDRTKVLELKKIQSNESSSLLAAFLMNDRELDSSQLNHIKCQILDLFEYVKKCEQLPDVDLDYKNWTYDLIDKKVNFPFKIHDRSMSSKDIRQKYRAWSDFLKSVDYFFIKPTKLVFNPSKQKLTRQKIYSHIQDTIANLKSVSKIYVMGSIMRKELGAYASPFIHSTWAKLGSDIDILIEMQSKDSIPPESWEYINVSSANSCDIYHVSQVKMDDEFGFQNEFPHIDFFHHLLDAYVYFPDKSDTEKKNAFLKKFGAKLIYSANSNDKLGINLEKELKSYNKSLETNSDSEPRFSKLKSQIEDIYGVRIDTLSKMTEATENELYKLTFNNKDYVLKVYKVSGNYNSKRISEHADYEAELVANLSDTNVKLANIFPDKNDTYVNTINGYPAILYSYEDGRIYKYPDPNFPIVEATQVLANLHNLQISKPFKLNHSFSFDDVFNIWHSEFYRFMYEMADRDKDISQAFSKLKKMYNELKGLYQNIKTDKNIPWLHNHGDVTPRNFVIRDNSAILIDFQNAFFGPRLLDVIDGAYEFSFGGKPPGKDDFNRFDEFINTYKSKTDLTNDELSILDDTIKVCGVIKFIKEVRMIKESKKQNNLRRLRALSVSKFLINRFL